MVETPADELSLRDILETLKRQWVWLLALPVLLGVLALIYGFFIAEPTYASTATLSVAPVQVQAQLEQRIQVQQATPITFEKKKEGQEGGGKEVAPGVVQPPHGQNGHQEERKEQ